MVPPISGASLLGYTFIKDINVAPNESVGTITIETLLFGYGLEGYLDGSHQCPPAMVKKDDSNEFMPNPEHMRWRRQDALIRSAMMASVTNGANITPSLHLSVSSTKTSAAAWSSLSRTYANQSRTRLLGLQESLRKFTKETKSISEYMMTMKSMVDNLALIRHPLSDDDICNTPRPDPAGPTQGALPGFQNFLNS
ncbi:hypothetical protein ACOSP7_004951 [Xanthoceras sorbifolium]